MPRQVILKRFGVNIKASALEEVLQKTLKDVIAQEEIEPIDHPQLRSSADELLGQYQPGEPFIFTASVEVPPDVTLEHYQGLQITVEKAEYQPEQVDQALEEYRRSEATLVPVEDRPAQETDEVLLDLSGQFAPEADSDNADAEDPTDAESVDRTIEGSTVDDFKLDLSKSGFLPGLVEGIIGMALGETKDIPITIPEDYFQKDLAGKDTVFTVALKDIKAKELPDLDDDFAQAVSEFETLAELRQFLEDQYQQQAQDKTEANIETALLEALLADIEVEPPESLIKSEIEFLIKDAAVAAPVPGLRR